MRRTMLCLLVVISATILILFNSPFRSAPEPRTLTESKAEVVPTHWIRHSNSKFSFIGPTDLKNLPVNGIDSFVGRLQNKNFLIEFDYGMYSNSSFDGRLTSEHHETFELRNVSIHGRRGRIGYWDDNIYPKSHPLVSAVYIPKLWPTGQDSFGGSKLYLKVCYKDKDLRSSAEHILMSIQQINSNNSTANQDTGE